MAHRERAIWVIGFIAPRFSRVVDGSPPPLAAPFTARSADSRAAGDAIRAAPCRRNSPVITGHHWRTVVDTLGNHRRTKRRSRRAVAASAALLLIGGLAPATVLLGAQPSSAAPVGAGFTLQRSDLEFILKQIKIAERHVAGQTPDGSYPCSAMLDETGTAENAIPTNGPNGEVLPWGLRTVSGTCNNLIPGQQNFGAADQTFPHKVPREFRPAYATPNTPVTDAQPRTISNLIVDQTITNPAAVAASGEDPATHGRADTLSIPNVAPDVGLSAPFNSVFTLFGQFFDHGLDLVAKPGPTIRIPLQADDPLVTHGPDGISGNGDEVPVGTPMTLSRAVGGGVTEPVNLTTPFVDQNQTYTSHPSHQVFLRDYDLPATGGPVLTGRLIDSDEGMATWARVKEQARTELGIELGDTDALNVPLLRTDPYGHFVPGTNGFPQLVTDTGLVEGDPANPVSPLAVGARRTGHAFLDDIAHTAVPVRGTTTLAADADDVINPPGPPSATYDDELLEAHFVAGDGRANENIGLTAIHHIFHSEHNRLTTEIDGMITAAGGAFAADWHATNAASGWGYGERLFQAARFVTEMQYQHLVFEEFARKVQPMVNLFGEGGTGYETVTNPAIAGEFAHAVYRFGHSMLTETIARRTAAGANHDIPLLTGFLNPPAFRDAGAANPLLTPRAAAGEVFRGMSRQVGNEIDEFVTEALRNNLLGLPLDLPSINLARARDTGIPPLNTLRAAFYEESNNSAMKPYTSWRDFEFSLKHRQSLVNFVAAYGRHPSITGTLAERRTAAEALVNPSVPALPGETEAQAEARNRDAFDFMNATRTPAPDGGLANPTNWETTPTGMDDVDLWIGGLAEKQMVFGGLLGSTFNYVFEKQLEDLQFGDRFYYLSRTQGLNLLVQLEGNSFAELIMRNTDVSGLPADVFSRPDFVFNMNAIGSSGAILDDPDTEWNESTLLTRMPNGTVRFGGPEHTVWNGVDAEDLATRPGLNVNDRVQASEGDDTIRGNSGNDVMEGGDGADNLIGGDGDDRLTDLCGDDVLKGGPGNDALSSGQGFAGDLNQGGPGKDFIIGGNDTTETFGGPGDDMVFAGDGEDTVFGDDGDDWVEGGFGPFNLLQGDSGQAFQNDPFGGHDVLDGDGGEQDYDSEGGDDIMLAGPGIQRNEGMLGFDWVTHKGDPQAADADMDIGVFGPPTINDLRDRFDLVEAMSGWDKNDVLRGDSRVAADLGGDLEHNLTAAGIARIQGLQALLPAGLTSFNAGNILVGGAGSDLIEGRGGDDVIDGDAWLNVKLVAPNPAVPGTTREVDSVKQLQADVFAGRINPGDITILRRIEVAGAPTDVDTAVFTGPRTEYTVTVDGDVVTVTHDNGGVDGTDTLRNVEELRFGTETVDVGDVVAVPDAPTIGTATAGNGQATVTFTAPADTGGLPITTFRVQVFAGGSLVRTVNVPAPATSAVVENLANGTAYTFRVVAVNTNGDSLPSGESNVVTPNDPTPAVTSRTPAGGATGVGIGANVTVTFDRNVSGVNGTTFRLFDVATGAQVPAAVTYNATSFTATLNPNANLANDRLYEARLQGGPSGINSGGTPLAGSNWSFRTVPDTTRPTVIGRAPAAGATGVGRGANVRATFSERVVGVNGTTLRLRVGSATGRVIAGQVSLDAAGTVATLNPTATLARNTRYVVVVDPPIRDGAGNQVLRTTWAFTTAR
ncbi:MAG: heme peroxidase [Nocardioidaceae bacterium]|nr:heme peroxidase [Nocardioidaceae bacterium]